MRWIGTPMLALVLVLACSPARELDLAVVDVEQAFQRSPLAMVAALELKKELGSQQRALTGRGRVLAGLRQQLEHGGAELDDAQRAELDARLHEATRDLMESQREYRVQLAEARQRQGERMIARVETVARELARDRGLRLVLRKEGRLFDADGHAVEPAPPASDMLDLTEPVIRALLERINPRELPEPGAS